MSSIHSLISDHPSKSRERAVSSTSSHPSGHWGGSRDATTNRNTVEKSHLRTEYPPPVGSDDHCSFTDRREALFVIHFVQELAPVIDICDPSHYFGTEVPKRALHSPLLSFSILCFASRDWALVNGCEDEWSTEYCSLALQLLIPVLDGPIESLDENVFAAIVLLRLYEEMTDADMGTHLLGSTRLLNSASSFACRGGLGEAASWIVLRQHIYLSITRYQPIRIDLDYYLLSSSFKDSSPESLANRMVLLCGRALSPSYNMQGRFDYEGWTQLRGEIMQWYDSVSWPLKPTATPCFARDDAQGLPNLWVAKPVHAIAYQHFYFAMLLLAVYEPRNWVPGTEALLSRPRVEEDIQNNLIMIVSLAISNPKVIVVSLTAHHILFIYGAFLQKYWHRRAVLDFLTQLSKKSGWPAGQLVAKLQELWPGL